MHGSQSSYYPRRAASSGLIRGVWYRLNRRWRLDRLPDVAGVGWSLAIASFFIPSLGFWGRWRPRDAALVSAACLILTLLFFAFLGLPAATWALGLLFALHVTGFLLLFRPLLIAARLPYRIALIVGLVVGYAATFYLPAQEFLHEHFLMPLRIGGQTLIVNRMVRPHNLRRGEWAVFAYDGASAWRNHVRMPSGYSASPVYGLPGDRVEFTPAAFLVNGVPVKRREFMPLEGELHVPKGCFFVWPQFIVHNQQLATTKEISNLILSRAIVLRSEIVGRPYKRWFWRKPELL